MVNQLILLLTKKKIIMKKIFTLFFLVLFFCTAYSQEETEWKPQTHITGYVNTIAEYVDMQLWKDVDNNVGIGLSEAAFLVSYKPLQKLEFKGTLVYTLYQKYSILIGGSLWYLHY